MDLVKEFFKNTTALGSLVFHGFAGILFLFIDIKIFFDLLIAQGISLAIIVIIRTLYFKNRPGMNLKPKEILARLDASSFPSMHSAHSMIFALVVGFNTQVEVLIILILLSVLIAYSRLILKKHYWTDILSGLGLGAIIGLSVVFLL